MNTSTAHAASTHEESFTGDAFREAVYQLLLDRRVGNHSIPAPKLERPRHGVKVTGLPIANLPKALQPRARRAR